MLTTALVSLFVLVVHGPEVVLCGSSGGRPSSPSYGINPYALTPSYPTESGRRNQGWNSFGKNRRMKDYGTLDQVSQTYIRVMEKMEKYCKTPYEPETDDKIIDMYSQCFSNLIQAVSLDCNNSFLCIFSVFPCHVLCRVTHLSCQ